MVPSAIWPHGVAMKPNPPSQGIVTSPASRPAALTRGMQRERAVELAYINGHAASAVSKSDWEQAKRELKSETNKDPTEAVLEAAPESERWDPVPGSTGHQAPETLPDDENEEGNSETQQLAAAGVEEAARDQALQAAIAANKTDREDA